MSLLVYFVDGTPIDAPKTELPTAEQINEVQQKIMAQLQELFEKYKYSYLDDPENAKLVFL